MNIAGTCIQKSALKFCRVLLSSQLDVDSSYFHIHQQYSNIAKTPALLVSSSCISTISLSNLVVCYLYLKAHGSHSSQLIACRLYCRSWLFHVHLLNLPSPSFADFCEYYRQLRSSHDGTSRNVMRKQRARVLETRSYVYFLAKIASEEGPPPFLRTQIIQKISV